MFENDYIMRQIESTSRVLAKILFQKELEADDAVIIDEKGNLLEGNLLLFRLRKLTLEMKINEAENLLFETIEREPSDEYLKTAFIFYDELQELSDEELEDCNFSREEIFDGLKQIQQIYDTVSGHINI